jgi:transposase InsO family protein
VIYRSIDAKKAGPKITVSCTLMGVSPSGYFAWKKRFSLSGETYGAPRIWHDLQEDGIGTGRNRIARLMRENDLKAHQKRRFKKTTDSQHSGRTAPNL